MEPDTSQKRTSPFVWIIVILVGWGIVGALVVVALLSKPSLLTKKVNQSSNQSINNPKEQKLVCKRFTNIEDALNNVDIACDVDLSNQNLTALPKGFEKLTKLETITLKGNKFSVFPAELLMFKNLIMIDLSNNTIASLPQELTTLTSLQQLNMENNTVSTIPSELFMVKTPLTINLKGNKVTRNQLEQEYKKAPSLLGVIL